MYLFMYLYRLIQATHKPPFPGPSAPPDAARVLGPVPRGAAPAPGCDSPASLGAPAGTRSTMENPHFFYGKTNIAMENPHF